MKEREAEELRLKKEKEEREKEQLLKERNEMKMKIDLERLENLKKTTVGAKALADVTVDVSTQTHFHSDFGCKYTNPFLF